MVPWAVKKFGFDPDKFVHELVDSIIGDHYPVPDRMLVHNEQIVHEYWSGRCAAHLSPTDEAASAPSENGTAETSFDRLTRARSRRRCRIGVRRDASRWACRDGID